ncbi:MAG: LacI family DNA-binding transcriptional regulator [Actinobacteria bacterium]|nr:LacI family DNA-binding transcriptional regulator [Actinomycetota bacterium]MSY38324.1 LacI family DNA-binding transcriptional regulator [Actinomycetota bacterium]
MASFTGWQGRVLDPKGRIACNRFSSAIRGGHVGITIRDVAQAAGVSTATVSRALRGLANVDEQTRTRVERAAAELDYVISPSASRLASGRTGSVAVITPYIARWFFSTVLSGVESTLQGAGMDLLLMTVSNPDAQHRLPPAPRLRRRVDGVLVIAIPPDDPQLSDVLKLDIPTSLIGVTVGDVPSVTIDDVHAARMATQHLINLGHQRIGLISGSIAGRSHYTAEYDRHRGYVEAMNEAKLPIHSDFEAHGYFTSPGGEQAMTELLAQRERPTAVFCMSDEMAFGAMRALRSHGLQPGRDVSLIGVDGHDMSELLELTTVEQPVHDMGRIAAEALLVQLNSEVQARAHSIVLPTRLVVRSSTAPVGGGE